MSKPVIRPGTITREQAVGNIIESVALEEAALAHILNAESEKLKTVMDFPRATPQQLMAINKSVKSVINAVSRKEMMMQAKLEMFDCTICQQF